MKKISHCLPMLAAAFGAPAAHALGLGELQSYSATGARLQATVDVYASPAEAVRDWQVELLPDGFAGPDTAPATVLSGLRARFMRAAQGRSYIQIDSLAPIDYSKLAFRLRVHEGAEAMSGRYVVSLAAPAQPVVQQARQKPRRARAKAPQLATNVELPTGLDAYGPVRPGESLWIIARKLGGGSNVNQIMQTLFLGNPEAFVGGDMNRLRVGAVLTLPTGTRRTAEASAAPVEVAPAPTVPTAATSQEVAVAPPPAPAASEAAADSTPPTTRTLAETDPELAARLAALDRKFADIRAQLGVPAKASAAPLADAPTAGPVSTPAPIAALAPAPTPAAAPAPAAIPPAATAAAPKAQVSAPAAKPAAKAQEPQLVVLPTPIASPSPLLLIEEQFESFGLSPMTLLGALAAAGIGVFIGRRALGGRRTNPNDPHRDPALEATLKAEVARKSENRVRLEQELKGLASPTPASKGYGPDTTVQLSAPPPLPRGSRVEDSSEIDTNIASGHYPEAELLLRKLIQKEAGNAAAKLRLAEVLYITEQSEAFAALAQEMMGSHRKEIADDDWQRVIRMGKMIAPDYPLFSGPRQVGMRA